MYAKFPKMAAEWEKHTAKGKKLPEHKHEDKPLHKYLKDKQKF
jgi:hypothetical protein